MKTLRRMLLVLTIATALLIQSTVTATATNEGEQLCDRAVVAARSQLADMKDLVAAEKEFTAVVQRQRDDAWKAIDRQASPVPWYLWLLAGAAGVTVLQELRR